MRRWRRSRPLGQSAGRARQSGEVADRDDQELPAGGGGEELPLCPAFQWARHRAQDAGAARDRDRADHGARPRGRADQPDDHVGACLRRVDCFGLAGLPSRRYGKPAAHGSSTDVRPPLRFVHAGRHRRRGRSRCTRSLRPATGLGLGEQGRGVGSGAAAADHRVPVEPAGGLQLPPRSHGNGRHRGAIKPGLAPVLSPAESAALRDRLLAEIANLPSQDSATSWAQAALAAKNRLTAEDAKLVADVFEQRLSAWSPADGMANQSQTSIGGHARQSVSPGTEDTIGQAGTTDEGKHAACPSTAR